MTPPPRYQAEAPGTATSAALINPPAADSATARGCRRSLSRWPTALPRALSDCICPLHYGGAAARRKGRASRPLPIDTTSLPKGIFSAHHCSSCGRARSMKLVVKLMVVVLVTLLSVPALAGRAGSGARSGGSSHSAAHFSGGRHFVPGGHFVPGSHFIPGGHFFRPRHVAVFLGVGIPFYAYYPPPLPYYYDYAPGYYAPPAAIPQQQGYWHFCPSANAYYPYVQQCPEGWQAVAPVPPS